MCGAEPLRVRAFLKYDSGAASARHRLLQFIPYLQEHGIEVVTLPLFGNDHLARIAAGRRASPIATSQSYARRLYQLVIRGSADVDWVQYEFFPYLPSLAEAYAASGRTLMLDYDDAVFHMYDAHQSRIVRTLMGRKLQPLMRMAKVVTCGNRYIQDYASRFCADTPIIPTVVDTQTYVPAGLTMDRPRALGWIGSPSTWAYVEPLLPTLLPLLHHYGWKFQVIGAGPRARGIHGIDAITWSEQNEVADIQAMDIGIMPVPDDKWTQGKCGFKLIQYMACGLPVVASPVGVNRDLVCSESGFLASSASEWVSSLKALICDPQLRRSMGIVGRDRAVTHYSLASQQHRVLNSFRRAAGSLQRF